MEQPPTEGPDGLSAERAPDGPRIYVASLADYNAGWLHGVWLDADQAVEELEAGVAGMLAASPEPGAEEYAVHDYDGFGSLRLDEYESLATIAGLAAGIAERGLAFAAWAELIGTDDALERRTDFDDAFLGTWATPRQFVEQLSDDLGWDTELNKLPDGMRMYVSVDYDLLTRDLRSDLYFVDHDDGVWVFDGRL